jgi:hypothetical protein
VNRVHGGFRKSSHAGAPVTVWVGEHLSEPWRRFCKLYATYYSRLSTQKEVTFTSFGGGGIAGEVVRLAVEDLILNKSLMIFAPV